MIPWFRSYIPNKQKKEAFKLLSNNTLSENKLTFQFERKLSEKLNHKYIIAVNSGSISLLMCLMILNLNKKNDEVLIANRSWISTLHAVKILKLKTIFIDVKKEKPIIDENLIEKSISKNTKVLITVNRNGRFCDTKKINKIVKKYNLRLIEDNAQSIFSKDCNNKFINPKADFTCFSFGPTKLINLGQGGAIVTKNSFYYKKILKFKYNGLIEKNKDQWDELGFNFKYTDLQAAFGIVQLKYINKKKAKLKKIYNTYNKNLKNIKQINLIPIKPKNEIPIYAEVLCKKRKKLIEYLYSKGIEVKPFFKSLNDSPLANKSKFVSKKNNSNFFSNNGIWLPSGSDQSINNIIKTCKYIRKFYDNFN